MLYVFDVNETLLDLAGLDDFFAERFGDRTVRTEWFDQLIYSALAVTAAGGYEQFGRLAGAALTALGEQRGRTITDDDRTALARQIAALRPHDDVRPTFDRLRAAGHTIATLTNSTAAVAEDQLANAGLRASVDAVHSADTAGQLKPGRAPYELVLREHGVRPAEAVLIAAHDWDIAGAHAAGWHTGYVGRGRPWRLASELRPSARADGLVELADRIDAAAW